MGSSRAWPTRPARDVVEAAEAMGDDSPIADVAKGLGLPSTTTQEAFMTAVRVRLAESRARKRPARRQAAQGRLRRAGHAA